MALSSSSSLLVVCARLFQQNVARIADDVISSFKGSLELWPSLVEIAYLHKRRSGLSSVRVANPRRELTVADV